MALKAVAAPLGSPVGGSGTPGTIPVWSSGTTLGDSIVKQDTNTIGIRQATPSAYLAGFNTLVVGDPALANTGITLASGTASDGTFAFADGTAGNAAYRGYIQYKHATDTMQIGTAASPQITILSTGSVGIGTASPASKLEIATGTAGTQQLRLSNSASTTNYWDIGRDNAVTGDLIFRTNVAARVTMTNAGNVSLQTTAAVFDASGTQQGLKLPATPGNADTQTFDAYNEVTLSSGFVTSGITSTGTIVITARITRYARGFGVHMKVAPSGGASLTFAAGWYVTLTGAPQMPEQGALSAYTTDGVGRVAVQIDGNATPSIAGMTTGNYGALGANVAVICSGFVT